MLESYFTGLTAVVVVTLAWVGVQGAWRRVFPELSSDPDVLAGRMGCHGCAGHHCQRHHRQRHHCQRPDCRADGDSCERKNDGRPDAAEEDTP